jgi:putative phosphoesterase
VRLLVLSDTHLSAATLDRMPAAVWELAEEADAVLHAGDVVDAAVLQALGERAPVHAVLGNNDDALRQVLPETLALDLGGVHVTMIHDSGPRAGREGRMRRRFPEADVVVFGHSHIPWNAEGLDGQLLFNPGSATQRRRQPHRTAGVLDLDGGRVRRAEIVVVD